MATYVAHYKSPRTDQPVSGSFEFESEHRAGSKQNMHDARMHMLTMYGNEAVTWNIDSVEQKRASSQTMDGQMELDFREPAEQPKRRRKTVDRGRV